MATEVGSPAPDFTAPTDNEGDFTLSDHKGKNIVLYFYPKDNTPGCTTQACDLRDNLEVLASEDILVVGVSPDSVKSHAKFRDKHSLNFTLVADEEKTVCEAYDVWLLKKMYGREFFGVARSTFIIDKEGILRHELRNVRVKGHAEKVRELVAAL